MNEYTCDLGDDFQNQQCEILIDGFNSVLLESQEIRTQNQAIIDNQIQSNIMMNQFVHEFHFFLIVGAGVLIMKWIFSFFY